MAAHVRRYLIRQVIAAVIHGQHYALNLKPGIEGLAHHVDGADELGQTFQGKEFALQGHHHSMGSCQGIDRQQPQRRRAIYEYIVVVADRIGDGIAQAIATAFDADQLELGAREIDGRGHHVKPRHGASNGGLAQCRRTSQDIVTGETAIGPLDPQAGTGIALWIQVENQNPAADGGHGRGQVDCRRSFADATFLIGDRQDPRLLRSSPGYRQQIVIGHGTTPLRARC